METRRAFRDFWFLFDLVLVVFMLAENAILPIINTVRDTEGPLVQLCNDM